MHAHLRFSIGRLVAAFLLLTLIAAQASAALIQGTVTSTSQVINPSNVQGGAAVLAAVDLSYYNDAGSGQSGVAAPGVVNGVTFQNIDFLGGTQALTGGGSLTPVANLAPFSDSTAIARNQNASVSGPSPDAGVLNSILNEMGYDGDSAGNFRTLEFSGLHPGTAVQVQLFGGDSNWTGGTGTINLLNTVTSGSTTVGTWNISDGNMTTAAYADFPAQVDGNGNLFIQVVTGGSPQVFVALAGAVVVSTPEPASAVLLGLSAVGLLVVLRPALRRNCVRALKRLIRSDVDPGVQSWSLSLRTCRS